MKAKLIVIGGVSRSGKTTLAGELASLLPNAIIISQDDFVLSEKFIPTIKDRINWEDTKSIDWISLIDQLNQLLSQYQFILLEGIFAYNSLVINDLVDYAIYLKLDYKMFIERRRQETRWGMEPHWYIDHVWKAHLKFANPYHIEFQNYCPYSPSLAEEIAQSLL